MPQSLPHLSRALYFRDVGTQAQTSYTSIRSPTPAQPRFVPANNFKGHVEVGLHTWVRNGPGV